MLEFLHLKGAPAFDPTSGVSIGPLNCVNIFFGPNGSGKTTISRALQKQLRYNGTTFEWDNSGVLGIKVYNRDYMEKTLAPASHLPGVFLLGEESTVVQAEIQSLTGTNGAIATVIKQIRETESSLSQVKTQIVDVKKQLRETAWSKRNEVPAELRVMFEGLNSNKELFLERLLSVASNTKSSDETMGELQLEATAILDKDARPLSELPIWSGTTVDSFPGYNLLGVPVVGTDHVSIAPLINKLQNADWVKRGRELFEESDGICPFCQQQAPQDLAQQLNIYFDKAYTEQIEALKTFKSDIETWERQWTEYFEQLLSIEGASYIDSEQLKEARLKLELAVKGLIQTADTKLSSPSVILTAELPYVEIESIRNLVANANLAIQEFNNRLNNRDKERKSFLDRCWAVFARVNLATEVATYEGAITGPVKGKNSLEERLKTSQDELEAKRLRLSELENKVTSSKPVIERINSLLKSVGFFSFSLAESDTIPDGYTLLREDGSTASETLSEGERTFISFLYFMQSLEGVEQKENEPRELLAVIDDPISSLDSDILYAVSTVIRRMIEEISEGRGRVRQLILLTHNAYFHKEVTYHKKGQAPANWKFGIVRKRIGQFSEIELVSKNPIKTGYSSLWDEVKRATSDPTVNATSLQNTLRRILETYFTVLGGVDDHKIIANFQGEDQLICRMLFSWVNAGSHFIFDELDYSPTQFTVEANLKVFRRIFEEQKQMGHYTMMMGEDLADASPLVQAI